MIYFITGNQNKFSEAKSIIPELEQLDIDLPEIQEIDSEEIIREKLVFASSHHTGDFVVEDTSLALNCLNGLPGPLIKWFEKTIGNDGIADIAKKYENSEAIAKVVVGYKSNDEIAYFEGSIEGNIVSPRGNFDFGWGPIFQPKGYSKTFGEMDREEKNSISMRKIAFQKLKDYLESPAN